MAPTTSTSGDGAACAASCAGLAPRDVFAAVALLAVLALVLPVAPAAAQPAGEAHFVFERPDRLEVSVLSAVEGREAQGYRRLMDKDADGNVTEEEARRSADESLAQFNGLGTKLGPPGGRILVDGRPAVETVATALALEGAEGAVALEGPITSRWDFEVGFPPPEQPSYLIRFEPRNGSFAGAIRVNITVATIVVPPGHEVVSAGGLPLYSTVSRDGKVVQTPRGINPAVDDLVLAVGPAPPRDAPAAAWMPPLALLAALALRRRTHR